jgi:hypothetical protein
MKSAAVLVFMFVVLVSLAIFATVTTDIPRLPSVVNLGGIFVCFVSQSTGYEQSEDLQLTVLKLLSAFLL